jgi:hypothetical protein
VSPRKTIRILSVMLATFVAVSIAEAADVTVTVSVDPNVVTVGEEVTLVVTVKGKFSKSANPELPPLDDFTVYRAGTSQSFSFGTGGASSSLQYTYVLVPRKAGTFTIEPIRFRVGDDIHTAEPVTVEVVQSPRQMAAPEAGGKALPENVKDEPIFVRATVDNDTVFVNQQATWTLAFYTDGRLNLMRSPQYAPPPAEGLWAEDLPSQSNYYQEIQGRQYLVNEVKRAFFASAPGEYTIGQARVDLVLDDFGRKRPDRLFDDFFNRSFGGFGFGKPVTLKTPAVAVTVLPLPARGRPDTFSGLVGKGLELSLRTDKHVAQVGEPITLSLEFQGEGNFKTMTAPAVPQPPSFKMYESGTSSDLFKKGDVVWGRKKYEYVLIPQVEGEKVIPAVEVSYFDPTAKSYRTVRSDPIRLEVQPGSVERGRRVVFAGSGEDIEVLGRDINYIHPVPAVIRPAVPVVIGSPVYVGLHAVPLVALLTAIVIERRRKRFMGNVALARSSRAAREAVKKLDLARTLAGKSGVTEAYPLVSGAIYGYFADKLNVSVSGLTRDDIERFLRGKEARDEDLAELGSILVACDGALYAQGVSKGDGPGGPRSLADRAVDLLKRLDKELSS